jgi:hypothetical protein
LAKDEALGIVVRYRGVVEIHRLRDRGDQQTATDRLTGQ